MIELLLRQHKYVNDILPNTGAVFLKNTYLFYILFKTSSSLDPTQTPGCTFNAQIQTRIPNMDQLSGFLFIRPL